MSALRYDTNPGVRIKSLEALGPYVKNDVTVRDAMIEAVLHDSNPGVRAEALHELQPVKADSSVHMALQYLADRRQRYFHPAAVAQHVEHNAGDRLTNASRKSRGRERV